MQVPEHLFLSAPSSKKLKVCYGIFLLLTLLPHNAALVADKKELQMGCSSEVGELRCTNFPEVIDSWLSHDLKAGLPNP